jgi:hypothetical protein
VIKQTHLRTLMQDSERCYAMMATHQDIMLDYSRQNMQPETMVGAVCSMPNLH